MTTKIDAKSPILASVQEAASGLHTAGLIDKAAMRAFDALCIEPREPSETDVSEGAMTASIKRSGIPRG